MRNELEYIELIENYLRDELSATDKKAFEEQLKTDTKLQKEVELQKDVIKGVERVGVKQSIQKASKRYDNRRRGFFLGLFLVVVISGVVGINYLGGNPESIKVSENATESQIENRGQQLGDGERIEVLDDSGSNSEGVSLPKKEFQYFAINSSKDTTIKGKEGTVMTFKANSFESEPNTLIKIRLKEYYKMSDMAFSNLTTQTKEGKLLETGGMIYIDAKANNKKLALKKDNSMEIKFPFDEKKKDMILFDGKLKDKQVVWEEAGVGRFEIIEKESVIDTLAEEIFTIVEVMPEFPGGQGELFEYLGENIKYPKEALLKSESGTVYVNFTIDKGGVVKDERVIRGVSSLLDSEALRVVKSFPRWNPGLQRGKAVAVSYNIPIKFILKEGGGYSSSEIKHYNDSLLATRLKDLNDESVSDTEGSAVVAQKQNIAADANYYMLSSLNLGYINCDRFVNRGRRFTFKMDVGADNVQVKLVFKSIKGLMGDLSYKKTAYFNSVPEGEEVVVFAVKFIDNKPYICYQELNTSDKNVELVFDALTLDKLKEYKKRLNSL